MEKEVIKDGHWDDVSRGILDEDYINKNAQDLNWSLVLKNNLLSDKTLENNFIYLDFDMVSSYQSPGKNFLEKHLDQFNTYRLIRNKNIPDQFFFDHLDYFQMSELVIIRRLEIKTIYDNWYLLRTCLIYNEQFLVNKYFSFLPKSKKIKRKVLSVSITIMSFLLSGVAMFALTKIFYNFIINSRIAFMIGPILVLFIFHELLMFFIVAQKFNNILLVISDGILLWLSGETGKYDYLVSKKRFPLKKH